MSKMNFDRNSKEGFFAKKGFYVALAVCLIAVGAATWTAVNSVMTSSDATMNQPSSSYTASNNPSSYPTSQGSMDVNNFLSDIPTSTSSLTPSTSTSNSSGSTSSSVSSSTSTSSKVESSSASSSKASNDSSASSKSSSDSSMPKNDKVVASYYNMPVTGQVIKNFSDEQLQYSKTYNDWRIHFGIDIAADAGTSVKAAGDAMVVKIFEDPLYGNVVVLDHGNGIQSYYSSVVKPVVKVGDIVKLGQNLGALETPKSESLDPSHLHYAMKKDDQWVNPLVIMGMN